MSRRRGRSERRGSRSERKRQEALVARRRSLTRQRTVVGALAFIPLLGWVGCANGVAALCFVPYEWWLAIFSALFGAYLGLTIRLFRERRAASQSGGASARSGV